jgi:hypothetical protein
MTMIRAAIVAALAFVASPALAESMDDHLTPRIEMGELVVQPGVVEFNLKVAQLLSCLARSQTDAGNVAAITGFSGSGRLIRVAFAGDRWLELGFRPIGHASLLLMARGSDGFASANPDKLRELVQTLLTECRSGR